MWVYPVPRCICHIRVNRWFQELCSSSWIFPVKDETGSEEHVKYLDYDLELSGKTWENFVRVIGNNCYANKCIADLACVPFLGCAGHRFNLTVRDILEDYENTLSSINGLMSKRKRHLQGAELWKSTHSIPRTSNHTRWSCTFEILLRYFDLKDTLPWLESEKVDELFFTATANRRARHLLAVLRDLESVTKTFQ